MEEATFHSGRMLRSACLSAVLPALLSGGLLAADWPQWRYDAGRGAASPQQLPEELHLRWIRQLPLPRPAWPASLPALRFDVSYSPVAAGKMLYVPSMVTDTVTAYDTETGAQKWRFYADGPVRFAPVAHRGKVYFASDDGYLYCVDAARGTLVWRLRGGPSDRKVLGNERLISTWPVRGGPVLRDGAIYFTAGIWPFMGIFVHAVDAETGLSVWTNSGGGSTYQIHPHDSPAFGGFVPRGYLAVTNKGLVAPGGRTPPGTYDLRSGELISFEFDKKGGRSSHQIAPIKAGSRTYSTGQGVVTDGRWKGNIEGEPWTMLAADQKLFVVTTGGRIYCFGAERGKPITYGDLARSNEDSEKKAKSSDSNPWWRHAEAILRVTETTEGYCVVLGLGSGGLAEAVVRQSKLQLIAIDPDAEKIDAFRRRMDDAGLYGTRVAAHVGDPLRYPLPPYLASLIVSEDPRLVSPQQGKPLVDAVLAALRPYGGAACLPVDTKQFEDLVKQTAAAGAGVKSVGRDWTLLVREGALPGAADWTHQYADAAASVVSRDTRVRLPLGLLWFGNGPPNDEVLPRHGHGPSPQVAAGRLFIEGPDMLRALDIYTGRLLWQKELPGLGRFYDHTGHQPGASEIGSNYVSLADAVYVVYGDRILELDAASGNLKKEFKLQPGPDDPRPNWGFIAAWEDLLIATSTPIRVEEVKSIAELVLSAAGFNPLLKAGDQWQYLAGADPKEGWTAVDYDAKGWKTGDAGFGYGDNDDRTVLSNMRDRYSRVYVRKSFDGNSAADATQMTLMVNYDDAFIAYLNGKEVVRQGVGRRSGKKASRIVSHEAHGHEAFPIEDFRQLLRPGRNVIAIEGHNAGADDSDFSLDPFLIVKTGRKTDTAKVQPEPGRSSVASTLVPGRYSSASRRLVVYNRHSGERLWERAADYGFRHNNIAVGGGRLFCIDGMSRDKLDSLKRRGKETGDYRPRLTAFEVRTGKQLWSTEENVFGTFLNYSTEHDVLLQAGSFGGDRAPDESDAGMVAYRGKDGKVIWKDLERDHTGPCMLHHDSIIAQGRAYSLFSGKPKLRKHPLTDKPMEWRYTRNYGCNTAVASEHLITFRSAAAGYYDLAGDGGTGNFGGFKSGCTSNLIVAGGLLNAPEYTRTCTCNYQNQTSLALVHDPDVEMWTFNALEWDGAPVRRVGVNFGAPGDRRDAGGTLWLDWPSRGGPSPDLPVKLEPGRPDYFRYHSSRIQADPGGRELNWVAASGVEGLWEVVLTLGTSRQPRSYTVRLHFAEVEDVQPGQRVFNVSLQGHQVLDEFDVVKEAGGPNRAVVKGFRHLRVRDTLTVSFSPCGDEGFLPPMISGVEVVAEEW